MCRRLALGGIAFWFLVGFWLAAAAPVRIVLLLVVAFGLVALAIGRRGGDRQGARRLPRRVSLGLIAPVIGRLGGRQGADDLPRRVPPEVGVPVELTWLERPFAGWARSWWGGRRLVVGTPEDSVGVVGPPRAGKTAGVLIPQLLLWGGPAISASTKPDVMRATAGRRWQLADRLAGRVYVYAPTETGLVEGVRPMRWSPLAGCADPRIATLRVEALVATASRGVELPDHWRTGASRILRPYFLAAAHHPVRAGDFVVVREWLARRELNEPLEILSSFRNWAGDQWAGELRGVMETPPRELGSFFSAASGALRSTADPQVLRSTTGTDFDPVEFLLTRSTLYIVSPTGHQEAVAPLISAFIESIITTAYDLHRDGRMDGRLLASLDELANIAPLPHLGSTISQGGGQGVVVSWAVQSLAQLRHRYGEHEAEAIWAASRVKLVFGGLSDTPALQSISELVGQHQVRTRTKSYSVSGSHWTRGWEWRPRLSVAELYGLPPGWALLLYHEASPYLVRAPIAVKRRVFRRGLLPWPPAPSPAPAAEAVTADRR
jgi:type IV secretion system protein VirD4